MNVAYLIGDPRGKNSGKRGVVTDAKDAEKRVTRKTILLVEDDDSHAELISRAFEDVGSLWEVQHVLDLDAAFAWLEKRSDSPALVIADYLLPDGTGLDLTRGAMSPEEVSFPLIIITGVGSEQLAVHAIKSGALDYVVKNPEELRELPWRAERAIREWKILTRRKRLEDELEIYMRELERVTQELGDSVLLLGTYAERFDEVGREYLVSIQKATERTVTLTEDLLMLTRVGRRFHELETVDLNELLEEIVGDLGALIEVRGGEILAGALPVISTQRVWIKELFINLIENGLKLSLTARPRVTIETQELAGDYLFSVLSNGSSSVKDEKDLSGMFTAPKHLFPYDYEGTNLRLSLCKKILDKLGGKIWTENGDEVSSAVYFSLPKK
ncbi:MAG: response regulator [Methanomicrobia archaeon]|nr:response regulator [Methanomicrobia archaeon]